MNSQRKNRKKVDATLKAKVAVAAIRGDKTSTQISSTFGVHSTQVSKWKKKALEELPGIFARSTGTGAEAANEQLISMLYEEIGRLKVEVDWLKKSSQCANSHQALLGGDPG
ncbi:MAG: hypothetical protein KJ927_12905 [Candidatus Eisenbacteria bacterium]|nr:hypothetical protein [Candidatus Eisenbacteria bacterium]